MNPKVSIVVPIYNAECYLPQCIESLIAQTLKEIEIVLVDDGSTDRSGVICDQYARIDSRIAVIHQQNQGVVRARKNGAFSARAPYIGCVDSDDFVDASMYETLYKAAVANQAEMVSCSYDTYFSPEKSVKWRQAVSEGCYSCEEIQTRILPDLFLRQPIAPSCSTKLFEKSVYLECLSRVDDRLIQGEDLCVSYQVLFSIQKLVIMESALYHYRYTEVSMSRGYKNRFRESIEIWHRLFADIANEQNNSQLRIELERAKPQHWLRCVQNEGSVGSPYHGKELHQEICKLITMIDAVQLKKYRDKENLSIKEKIITLALQSKSGPLIFVIAYADRLLDRIRKMKKAMSRK